MNVMNNETTNELALSTAQIIPLGIYCFIATTLGLFGNATVIYSSIRYDAIKLDKVSLIFVLNLAVADMCYIFTSILPNAVTYIAGRYVLGDIYCFVSAHVSFLPGSVNPLTILVLTAYRLSLVTKPLFELSETTAKATAAVIWCIATTGLVISVAYGARPYFSPTAARCLSTIYTNEAAAVLFKVAVTGLIVMVPLFLITFFNFILSVIAIRHSRRFSSRQSGYSALIMICSLSGLFLVSWVPYVIYTFVKANNPDVPSYLDLLGFHCIYLNAFGNPILYSFTNKRFGRYVKSMFIGISCRNVIKRIERRKDVTMHPAPIESPQVEPTSSTADRGDEESMN